VLLYQARFAGVTLAQRMLLVHWHCAEAIGLWQEVRPRDITQAPRSQTDQALYGLEAEAASYTAALAKIRTVTLYSMIGAYDDHPGERTSAMEWQILLVRREYDQRMARKWRGELIEVDETLATAADRADRAQIAENLAANGWSPQRIGAVNRAAGS
jgi:hypothetical protein